MTSDQFTAPDLLGSVVDGRFEILEKLGEGGMGVVYRARQISMDRMVALKILLRDQRGDPISVERFRHEAYLASRLKHPHAIIIHDFGQTADGLLYIAMEFLDGETLKARLRRVGQLKIQTAVKIITQMLRPIAEAHRMGLIHRDLKPDNLFLTTVEGNEDFGKVLDFGIAKLTAVQDGPIEGYQGGLTMQGKIYGTPNYMSPEQIRGKTVDHQSDLYSLGVIFYEMLAGRLPFVGDNPVDVMMMHLRDPPDSLRQLRPEVPVELERTVLRALEKDRRVRFRTGDEFLEAIENYKFTSGFYAVPARLAAMATATTPGTSPNDLMDEDDSEEGDLGATMMLTEGALPPKPAPSVSPQPIAAPSPAPDPGLFAGDSILDMPDEDDDDATMMGISVLAPAMSFDDPEEQTVFEPDESVGDDDLMGSGIGGSLADSVLSSPPGSVTSSPPQPIGALPTPVWSSAPVAQPVATPAPIRSAPVQVEEPTMLELDDDEFDEVEASRLIPIPTPGPGQPRSPFGGEPTPSATPVAVAPPGPPRPSGPPRPAFPSAPPRSATPAPKPIARPTPARTPLVQKPAPAARPAPRPATPSQAPNTGPLGPIGARRSSGGKGKWIALVAVLLIGGGVGAAFFLGAFSPPPPPPIPPAVSVTATAAGLEVFQDGRFLGETPFEFAPPSGDSQSLKLVGKKGTLKAMAPVVPGRSWLFVLAPEAPGEGGYLLLKTDPPGAAVTVGGADAGQTPLTIVGTVGQAVVAELSGEGGTGRVEVTLVTPGEARDVPLQ